MSVTDPGHDDPHSPASRPDEFRTDETPRRFRPRIRSRPLIVLVIGVAVIAIGWRIDWERKHPTAASARKIRGGDPASRIQAIRELEGLGSVDPAVAIPALVVGLGDPDAMVRAASAMALVPPANAAGSVESAQREVRAAVNALIRAVQDEQAPARAAAAQALWVITITWSGAAEMIDWARAVEALSAAAGDREVEVRLAGLRGLGTVGPHANEVPPPILLAALEDESAPIRGAAAMALVRFKRGLPRLVPELLRALESARPEVRPDYRDVLGAIQPPGFSAESVPALTAILGTSDPEARALAAWSLSSYTDKADDAIPALIRCLEDSRGTTPAGPGSPAPTSRDLMAVATKSWFDLGIPMLENAPSSRDPVIESARSLGRLAPPTDQAGAAIAALAKVLRTGSVPHRVIAAKSLARFPYYSIKMDWERTPYRRADTVQIAALTAALGDAELPVRAAALRTLHDVGMKAVFDASPELNVAIDRALEDPSPEIRTRAAAEVAHHGDVADRFFPALIRHAEHDPDKEVRSMRCTVITLESGPRPARSPRRSSRSWPRPWRVATGTSNNPHAASWPGSRAARRRPPPRSPASASW